MSSKNDTAIDGARQLKSIMEQFRSLRTAYPDFLTRYQKSGWQARWEAMSTAPLNDDGSIDTGTPDSTPVPTNPIIEGDINRSSEELEAAKQVLDAYDLFLNASSVGAFDRSKSIDDLIS